jgi:hypothetical protein
MHKKLIFGSTALKHWFPDYPYEPKDLDLITQDKTKEKRVDKYYDPALQIILENNKDSVYIDPDLLLTLKAAHANWLIHWEKTMAHILFLKSKDLKINKPIYLKIKKEFKKIHGRENAPLKNKNAAEFFSDKVSRKYNHDDLHQAVAYYEEPLFFRILDRSDSVECREDKFEQLSYEDKIKLAKEEIFVTALERYLIPTDFRYNRRKAYNESLRKFVTTMSTGWMSYFLIDNFQELLYKQERYDELFLKNKNKVRLNGK